MTGRHSFVLLIAFAFAGSAQAQLLTLVRQEAGSYAFETRVDTTLYEDDADPCPPTRALFSDDYESCTQGPWLVLLHNNVAIDSVAGMQVWLGAEPDTVAMDIREGLSEWPALLRVPTGAIQDLTGDGTPEVVISAYSGGAHCCTTLWIVSLGAEPALVATIEARDSSVELLDLDGDGHVEFLLADFAYAYWNTSFAETPAPQVVLAWDGERFAPSARNMRRPVLSADELARQIRTVRADESWSARRFPPVDYWGTLLDLLYAGQTDDAARFSIEAWNGDPMARRIFLRWLRDELQGSPYGQDVLEMNADWADAVFEP